jgi:hypothetical protein
LTTLLCGFSVFARDHSALNGTWTLVPAKSDFVGQPVVQTGTVTIADRDGVIIVSRNFAYEGATETSFYRDVTNSEHNATIHTGKNLKGKTSWDHDVPKNVTPKCVIHWRNHGLLRAHPFNDRDDWLYEDPGLNPPRKAQGVKLAKRRRFPENVVHGLQEVQYEA